MPKVIFARFQDENDISLFFAGAKQVLRSFFCDFWAFPPFKCYRYKSRRFPFTKLILGPIMLGGHFPGNYYIYISPEMLN
jgi:hypothetical protein